MDVLVDCSCFLDLAARVTVCASAKLTSAGHIHVRGGRVQPFVVTDHVMHSLHALGLQNGGPDCASSLSRKTPARCPPAPVSKLVPDCWQRLDSGKMVQGRRQVMAREASMLVVTVVSSGA